MLAKFSTFTEEQKKEIVEICRTLVALSNKARREGILALEDSLDDQLTGANKNERLMFALFRLMVDGIEGKNIAEVADNYIASSASDDFDNFAFTLIKKGVLSIQYGENPRVLQLLCLSYVGFDDEDWFCEQTGFAHWTEYDW